MHIRGPWRVLVALAIAVGVLGLTTFVAEIPGRSPRDAAHADTGIHKIRHVIVIMQENESFDSYFGTYPGADGLPMRHGRPIVCIPDPQLGRCVHPFHLASPRAAGGPHTAYAARHDVDGGRMDGFIRMANMGVGNHERLCLRDANDPRCTSNPMDVLGYRTRADIPN